MKYSWGFTSSTSKTMSLSTKRYTKLQWHINQYWLGNTKLYFNNPLYFWLSAFFPLSMVESLSWDRGSSGVCPSVLKWLDAGKAFFVLFISFIKAHLLNLSTVALTANSKILLCFNKCHRNRRGFQKTAPVSFIILKFRLQNNTD